MAKYNLVVRNGTVIDGTGGEVVYRDGAPTGTLPGRLIRGTTDAPVNGI